MSEDQEIAARTENKVYYQKPLVRIEKEGQPHTIYSLVSHTEVDSLIARLMQMCELTGDVEQRNALKGEIKSRVRDWLDDNYANAGYDRWTGASKDTRVLVEEQ